MRRATDCSCWYWLALGAGLTGCLNDLAKGHDPTTGPSLGTGIDETGIQIQAIIPADVDVTALQYTIQGVSCEDGSPRGEPIDKVQKAEEITGGIDPTGSLGADSSHLSAGLLQVVPAGCYDIKAEPQDATGNLSTVCAPAVKRHVLVEKSKTTEVFLLSQCKGKDTGALELIAALNHPPSIDDVSFSDKNHACGVATEICARASDLDSDPLELVLQAPDCDAPTATRSTGPGAQCWQVKCRKVGKASFVVRAYDQLLAEGSTIRIDDWFDREGSDQRSHAEIAFAEMFDGVKLWPDGDGDKHGDMTASPKTGCTGEDAAGFVATSDDCDDRDAAVYPGAAELCGDGKDNDCDGQAEEDCIPCTKPWKCDGSNGTYAPTCQICDSGGISYCFKTVVGATLCADDFWCADRPDCTKASDCAAGQVCVVDTCCNPAPDGGTAAGKCLAPKLECAIWSASESVDTSKGTAAVKGQ